MSYGIKSYGDDGYLNLHSDYSTMVYLGAAAINVAPIRPVYTGDQAETITGSRLTSNYDMGYIVQFRIQGAYSHIIPFYIPRFSGQEVAIMDMYNGGTYWDINVLYSGSLSQSPAVHVFVPLTEIPNPTQSDYGLTVYADNGDIVFTDRYRPLRVDDVVTVTHPSSIKTGSRGSCGNDANCDINYTPDQSTTATGSVNNTSTKMYHVVTSAYGGLAYQNDGTYSRSCGFLNLGTRRYAWGYQSWASFRGTISHPHNTANHVATYQGDFCGKIHRVVSGDCGFSGFLGAIIGLIGVVLAPITFGASLTLTAGVAITAAIVGFAVGDILSPSTPALRAYENDAIFDTANTQNLIVTDADYYGIDVSTSSGSDNGFTGTYQYSSTPPYYMWGDNPGGTFPFIWWADMLVAYGRPGNTNAPVGIPEGATSLTVAGVTYYRSPDMELSIPDSFFGGTSVDYYGVGRE
jgi:hypothetical protein